MPFERRNVIKQIGEEFQRYYESLFYNSIRPHRYNNYKSPDSTEKLFEKSMLSADLP